MAKGLHYIATLDNTDLKKKFADQRRMILDSGKAAEAQASRVETMFKRVGIAAGAAFSIGTIKQFGMDLITIRGQFQTFEAVLTNTLQSTEKAKQSMMMLQEFAATTPFQVDALTGAFVKLANQGFVPTYAEMEKMGDLASSTGKGFDQLSEAMIDAQTGEFERLKEFGIRASKEGDKVTFTFKGQATQVDFTTSSIRAYILSLGALNGVQGTNAEIAKNLAGQYSNLQNTITQTMNKIGQSSEGILSGAISSASYLVKHYEEIGDAIMVLITTYGTYRAALIATNAAEKLNLMVLRQAVIEKRLAMAAEINMTNAEAIAASRTNLLTAAKMGLVKSLKTVSLAMQANPYALVLAAVVGLGYGIYEFVSQINAATQAQAKLSKCLDEETKKLDENYAAITNAKKGSDERKTAIDNFNRDYGKYLGNLLSEKSAVEDVAAAYNQAKAAVMDFAIEKAHESYMFDPMARVDKSKEQLRSSASKWGEKLGDAGKSGALMANIDKIISRLEGGEKLSEGALYKAIEEAFTKQSGFKDNSYDAIRTKEIAFKLQREFGDLQTAKNEFEAFSTAYRDASVATTTQAADNSTKIITTVTTNLKNATDALAIAKRELEEAKTKDADHSIVETKMGAVDSAQKNYDDALKLMGIDPQVAAKAAKLQKEITDAQLKNILAAEKERIDLMADGRTKELEQIKLTHDAKLAAIDQEEKELKEKYKGNAIPQDQQDTYTARRATAGVDAKAQTAQVEQKYADEVTALYAQIGDVFLSEEERKRIGIKETYDQYREQLKQMLDGGTITQKEYDVKLPAIDAAEQKDILDALLSEITTYEQQRLGVQEKYAKKREALYEKDGKTLKEGVTQGNVDEHDRQATDAVAAVDETFAQREATYQVWMEEIADFSLKQLEVALTEAKQKLAEAEGSGADDKTLSTARAKVNTAETNVKKAKAKNETSPGKKTLKEWQELYSILGEVAGQFDEIGDAVGGAAGEAIKTAGQIAASTISMISSIMTFSTSSIAAIKDASTTATIALETVEAASVILAVIGAALQIATAIASLFNNDKAHQEEIEALQGRIEQLQWELDNVEIGRLKNNNVDILKNMRDIYAETTSEVLKLHAMEIARWHQNTFLSAGFAKSLAKAAYQNEILIASAEKLADFYTKVEYTKNKALGGAKYTEAQNALKNMAQQQLLLQKSIDEERAKSKDVDKGQIAKWEQQIQELGAEAIEMINTLVEDIIGGSASDIANDLGNAFFEAFRAGEDAAQAWSDKVNDIVADVMKRMLVQKYLEEPLGEVFDKYKKKWFGNGASPLDNVIDSMGDFANDLMAKGDEFKVIWDSLPDNIKDMFKPADEDREAAGRGIATASQESVDENNGRLTAIQGHTYGIFESMKLLQPDVAHIKAAMADMMGNAARQLLVMQGIEANTRSLVRLEQIELDMGSVKSALNDINQKGIKIR